MRCYNVLSLIKLLKALFLSMILICLLPDTCFFVMHINIYIQLGYSTNLSNYTIA